MGKSLSECTWEKQSSLPLKLIEDYEKGAQFDVVDDISQSLGQEIHTLLPVSSLAGAAKLSAPHAKKAKSTVPVAPEANTG